MCVYRVVYGKTCVYRVVSGVFLTGENSVWTSNQESSHPLHGLSAVLTRRALSDQLSPSGLSSAPHISGGKPQRPLQTFISYTTMSRATAHPALSQPANVRQQLRPLSAQPVFSARSYPTRLKRNENVLVVMTLADAASMEVTKLQKHDICGGPPRDTHMERPGNIAPPRLG